MRLSWPPAASLREAGRRTGIDSDTLIRLLQRVGQEAELRNWPDGAAPKVLIGSTQPRRLAPDYSRVHPLTWTASRAEPRPRRHLPATRPSRRAASGGRSSHEPRLRSRTSRSLLWNPPGASHRPVVDGHSVVGHVAPEPNILCPAADHKARECAASRYALRVRACPPRRPPHGLRGNTDQMPAAPRRRPH